jgi:hypothetical protein
MQTQTKRRLFDLTVWAVGAATMLALVAEADAGESRPAAPGNATWQTECGGCHVPYPPQLLPAASWKAIINGLDRHFGVDATVDARTAATIGAFLEANAAREGGERSDRGALRITQTQWFRHEHGEIATATWKNPKVGSAANCEACHAGAAGGDYSERRVRAPR